MKLSIFGVLLLFAWLLLPTYPIAAQNADSNSSWNADLADIGDLTPVAFGYTAQKCYPAGSPTAVAIYEDGKEIGTSYGEVFIGSYAGNGNLSIHSYLAPSILSDKSVLFHRLTALNYIETNEEGFKTIWSESRPKAVQYDKVPYYDLNTVGNLYLLSDDIRLIDKGDDAVLMNSESGDCYTVCSRTGDSEALPWFANKIKDYTVLIIDDHYATIVFTLEE
jgi:hypothetical protein